MDDPVVLSDDPAAHLDDPVVHSDEPVVHSDDPVVHLNDPAVPSNDPVDDPVVGHSEEVGSESSNRGRKVSGMYTIHPLMFAHGLSEYTPRACGPCSIFSSTAGGISPIDSCPLRKETKTSTTG